MKRLVASVVTFSLFASLSFASSQPVRGRNGMVVSQKMLASEAGLGVLRDGGSAVDAAVATALALAVTLPRAGNIGGGGFMVFRSGDGDAITYDFREAAPAAATADMFTRDGVYDWNLHHASGRSVGIPGTVAGLYMAWEEHGKLPWRRLVAPAIVLARDGIIVTDDLERGLQNMRRTWNDHEGTLAQFTNNGEPYRIGEILRQPDLAATLERIAESGPAGFYEGETARLIVAEMERLDGLITLEDLKGYQAKKREPIRGTYRGYEILSMPPPSSGGVAIVEILNVLEGYDMDAMGLHSAKSLHLIVEAMRRAFADRARDMGDPDFNPDIPIERLTSKDYADRLRRSINLDYASTSSTSDFEWPTESPETTHFSVVDRDRNAVSVTYTIERPMTIVTGGGFLLNSELGDFNAAPGLTNTDGLIGTAPNLAAPGKRPLSSMSPTIVVKDGELFLVTGSPGGRTIINTVVQTILHTLDFGLNAQEAIDAGRLHHQWLPDKIRIEKNSFSPDTLAILRAKGHAFQIVETLGCAQIILFDREDGVFQGGSDLRRRDGGVAAY